MTICQDSSLLAYGISIRDYTVATDQKTKQAGQCPACLGLIHPQARPKEQFEPQRRRGRKGNYNTKYLAFSASLRFNINHNRLW